MPPHMRKELARVSLHSGRPWFAVQLVSAISRAVQFQEALKVSLIASLSLLSTSQIPLT